MIYSDLNGYVVKGLYSFQINSVQDHGYTVIGNSNDNIFLPTEECEKIYKVGDYILGVVTESKARVVKISTKKDIIKKSTIKDSVNMSYMNIFPGQKFNGTVMGMRDNLIKLNIPGGHIGKAHYFHALSLVY